MTSVTVSRGSRSVTFDVYGTGGSLMVARDTGKPEASLYKTSASTPRFADHRAPMEAYTVVGQLVGSGAYEDARVLAEDIVRPASGGTSATLDLSNISGLDSETVGFLGPRSVALGYPAGQGEWVSLQLQAVVVDNTIGGTSMGDTGSSGSGSGPVKLDRDGTSITLKKDLDVERKVGRPENTLRHDASDNPYLVDKPRAYSDEFGLRGVWTTNASSEQNTLIEDIVKPPLGYGTLTLDFQGLLGLGSYTVAPVGSKSTRVTWSAGEEGTVRVDGLKLKVVKG